MRIIFTILLLAALHFAYGQSREAESTYMKEKYLEESKRQKTTASILTGVGMGLLTAGLIVWGSEFGDSWNGGSTDEGTLNTGEALVIVGCVVTLVSIPIWIAYRKKKKLAASLALENRRIWLPTKGDLASFSAPGLSIKIALGK